MGSAEQEQEFCLRWNNHSSTLISVLDSLLQEEALVDVILAAEGKFIKVHRLVLCACSQYFQDLLHQQFDKQAIVFLKDVRYIDLRALVDYMYRGEVNVAQDQLATFLNTAEALRIKGLADKDDPSKLKHRTPKVLPADQDPQTNRQPSSLVATPQKNPFLLADNSKPAEISSSDETLGSPLIAPELPHEEVIMKIANMKKNPDIRDDMEVEEHCISLTPTIEHETYETSLVPDQFESSDHWSTKEAEEDWNNSHEGLSNNFTSGNPTTQDTDPDSENTAGPSGLKTKRPLFHSTSKGLPTPVGPFSCPTCHRKNLTKMQILQHINQCGSLPSLSCPICHYRTNQRKILKFHMGNIHRKKWE